MKNLVKSIKSAPGDNKKRTSHLYLQEKSLKIIPKLNKTKDVFVLYLYGNLIEKMENLNGYTNLVSLYLQKNQINIMENLYHLKKLKKLYIGHNNIGVMEGLTNNNQLEELHIEKQYISEGTSLCFDPRSVLALSESLQVLNISHNNICSLGILSSLKHIKIIDASNNDLDDLKEVCEVLQNWLYLRQATFLGNPIYKKHRYRENIIAKSNNLEMLDGKCVSDVTRTFIKRFEAERMLKGSKPNINIANNIEGLPRNYSAALEKAVSASIIRDSDADLVYDLSSFDEKDAVYIAWKALPKRRAFAKAQHQKKKTADFVKKTIFVNSLPQL